MMARVNIFPPRVPIGHVQIGRDSLPVLASSELLRVLRPVEQAANEVQDGLTAAGISNTPAGGVSETTVQGAINELDADKQPKDATLTALAGVTTAADKLLYWTGVDAASVCDFTAFARSLIAGANASAMRTTLGLGTAAVADSVEFLPVNDPVLTGSLFFEQPTRTTKTGAATLTIAELLTKIIYYTGAAATLTMPTGANIDAGVLSGTLPVDRAFEFTIINSGSGTATLGVAVSGILMVGDTLVPATSSATFRVHKTASATFTVYRVN